MRMHSQWSSGRYPLAVIVKLLPLCVVVALLHASASFSRAATLISETFDSMNSGTVPPPGWTIGYLGAVGTVNRAVMAPYAGNTLAITSMTLAVSDGSAIPSPDVGTALNLGTTGSPDRALGNYPRTNPAGDHVMQVAVVNNTGGSLSTVALSYWGEQWRQAQGTSSSGPEVLRVLVSTTSATDGFTYLSAFDFTPKQGAANIGLDGNAAANRVFITNTITLPGAVPNGGTFYVRWHDWNDNGTTDHFLGIDDVLITTVGPPPPNNPPAAPALISPANTATIVSNLPTLNVMVSDPDTNNLTVTFYGRVTSTSSAPDFTFVALPDTQYYVSSKNGGVPDIFTNQTQWIVNNRTNRNIAYVAQLGDCVETGDNSGNPVEWLHATNALYRLENPVTTQHPPHGVPYGVAVGNHDQSPNNDPNGTTTFYNQFFGEAHFLPCNYYGGHYGTNNDNHYDLFSAGGMDFIVLYFEFDAAATATNAPVYDWANNLLQTYGNRRAIVVSHYIINANGTYGSQGQAIYNALKGNPNLFLMLCGHVVPNGESTRSDTFNSNTVWSVLSDYQDRTAGGNGWLRLYEFSPTNNVIRVKTYSPWLSQFETDGNSQFDIPYSMTPTNPFVVIGTNTSVLSGGNASITWSGLQTNTTYEWYATVHDGQATTTGPVWQFTTGSNAVPVPPTASLTSPADGNVFFAPASIILAAAAADTDGTVTYVAFYQGATKLADDMTVPYSHTWNGAAPGSYALRAVATDNSGLSTTSAVVNVSVNTPATAQAVDYVIHISVDGLRPDAITILGASNVPNFYRLRTQGAFTDNARNDYDYTITLPNHTCQLTGRGVVGAAGHNWTSNSDPAPGQTLASNKGSYVAGIYDVAHDNGLRTGHYASKSKFSLYDTTWNAGTGALDMTGADNGRDKIDVYVNNSDTAALVNTLVANMNAQPFHYVFLHLADPDTTGHASGWNVTPGSAYLNTVKAMDSRLGAIFSMVDTNLQLQGRTAIILTSDHGGLGTDHSNATLRENYTIPFYVWGPGIMAGADLYSLNSATRLDPGISRPLYSAPGQPVRNGDCANLILELLRLGPVPGSTINQAQSLDLTLTPPGDFGLDLVGLNAVIRFSLVANVLHDIQSRTSLVSGSWSDVFTNINGPGGMVTNVSMSPPTGDEAYYRLRLHF